MDSQSTARKTVSLSTGRSYSYIYIPAASSSNPTILFLHGFPSGSYDWRYQIAYFSALGTGVLAPDLLGYGLTDKPNDMKAYRGKAMAADIAAVLDHECLPKVHGVAHDFGAFLLSRCATYYTERFVSYTFLVTSYIPAGVPFDVDAANAASKEKYGYEFRGYYKFFARADAGKILAEHSDSLFSNAFRRDYEHWPDSWARLNALETSLLADEQFPLLDVITPADIEVAKASIGENFDAPLNWYKSLMANINLEDEKVERVGYETKERLKKPTLFVAALKDPVARADIHEATMKMWAEDLSIESTEAGHWPQLEKSEAVNEILESFFNKVKALT